MSDSKESIERSILNAQQQTLRDFISQGIQLSAAEFERQIRVLAALSPESAFLPYEESLIQVNRISKATALQQLKEKERKAQLEPEQGWTDEESTMTLGNNPTLDAINDNLAKRYISKLALETQKKEIEEFLKDKPIALRSFKRYWGPENGPLDLKRWLSFWWLAANDASPEITQVSSVDTRRSRFVYALEDTLRNGNRNKLGVDDGLEQDTKPSCAKGFYNKFCEAFFGLHPDNVFVGRIKQKMAELTPLSAIAVYNKTERGAKKELFEAIEANQSGEANQTQRKLVDRFLIDVYKEMEAKIKNEFAGNERLFTPLIEEFAPTAEWVKLPAPAPEVEKSFEATPDALPTKLEEQYKNQIREFEAIAPRYQCGVDFIFPENPVRVGRHPGGKELRLQIFDRIRIEGLKTCPLSTRAWNLGEGDNEHGPLIPAKKEMIFYAVVAGDWLQKISPQVVKQLDITLITEINELLIKRENQILINEAFEILLKLQSKMEIAKEEMSPEDIAYLKPLWSFKLDDKHLDDKLAEHKADAELSQLEDLLSESAPTDSKRRSEQGLIFSRIANSHRHLQGGGIRIESDAQSERDQKQRREERLARQHGPLISSLIPPKNPLLEYAILNNDSSFFERFMALQDAGARRMDPRPGLEQEQYLGIIFGGNRGDISISAGAGGHGVPALPEQFLLPAPARNTIMRHNIGNGGNGNGAQAPGLAHQAPAPILQPFVPVQVHVPIQQPILPAQVPVIQVPIQQQPVVPIPVVAPVEPVRTNAFRSRRI